MHAAEGSGPNESGETARGGLKIDGTYTTVSKCTPTTLRPSYSMAAE